MNNDNLKNFKIGEDSRRNKKGRPRKLFNHIIKGLEKDGFKAPSKEEYRDLLGIFLSMTEDKLREISNDLEYPFWVRSLSMQLLDETTREKMMKDYSDWLFGKAQQTIEQTNINQEPMKFVVQDTETVDALNKIINDNNDK